MIRIAICDDETKELHKTKRMLHAFAVKHKELEIKISTFTSPAEVMAGIKQQGDFHILLLDIYMPDMSGTELARFIRESKHDCQIIFLTTSRIHAVEAYSLHAAHYLVKPFTKEQLNDALSGAINVINRVKKDQVILKLPGGALKVNFTDFIYAEAENHIQNIHLADGKIIKIRNTSTELFQLLSQDNRFFKCGSTYIINMEKIDEITAQSILLCNSEQLPMQRRRYKELVSRYTRYCVESC